MSFKCYNSTLLMPFLTKTKSSSHSTQKTCKGSCRYDTVGAVISTLSQPTLLKAKIYT